ncbi:SDR family NAD(P)-dependent oxidoreductase [Actinophytocola xanthii]|uniref:SDR family NAD(P)-dependent oxidoreductase n=1 Tax=Actinophytocola xanthii TaxID=1912961 RepID=UPI0018E95F97|nr:SDR family NAD(P)-dependent oxidoreductase [Actinophytocola xanthii]
MTGASRGLGRAFALDLAQRGARLVLLARSAGTLRQVAEEIRERTGGAAPQVIVADLATPDGPKQAVRELKALGVPLDLLVNNAAIGTQGSFLARDLEPQLRAVAVNAGGMLALTHPIAADMVARGSGGIIVVTSGAAFSPMGYLASYGATKAFQLYFTEALAEELRGTGIQVMGAHVSNMDTTFGEGPTAAVDPKADQPSDVAARVLDDFARGRAASYPGSFMNRVLTWPSRVLPRVTVARVATAYARKRGLDKVVEVGAS